MSNLQTVQAIYAAFGQGDIPTILTHLADDIRWEDGAPDHGIPWLKPGIGHGAVLGFFQVIAGWKFERFEIQSVVDGGAAVIGLLSVAARTPGGSVDNLEVHIWRFNEQGKVCSFNHVLDTVQHLRVAQAA